MTQQLFSDSKSNSKARKAIKMSKISTKRTLSAIIAIIVCTIAVFLVSCKKEDDSIVKVFDDPYQVAQTTGLKEIELVPDGYKVSAHRTVYDIVSEAEYIPTEGYDKKNPKIVVFRAVESIYSITNLSGFENTALSEVYYPPMRSDLSLSIEARDEFLAVEWQDIFGGKECKLSISLTNGSIDEFKSIINQTLEYIGEQK